MKILGIIPARGGSKGVPGKNIKLLGEKPLLQYTFDSANDSTLLTRVVLSSEDDTIIATAQKMGLEVPFKRPLELATDNATSISVAQDVIAFFEKQGEYFDAICLLQATYPFREKDFIDTAIQRFIEAKVDALVSVLPTPIEYNPHWMFEEIEDGTLKIATGEEKIISRRQDLPKTYYRDGAIYITKTEYIKKGTFYGSKLGYIESNPDLYVNIDTMEDWRKAEEKLKYL